MSFADRAKEHRQNGGAFRFPRGNYNVRLVEWEFKNTKGKPAMLGKPATKPQPMFVLHWKITDKGDLRNKKLKDRFIISSKMQWQFDSLLVLLEDFGIDLSKLDDADPQYKGIQDCLEYLEENGAKAQVELTPQDEDPQYYSLKYLEVTKVGGFDVPEAGDTDLESTEGVEDLDEGPYGGESAPTELVAYASANQTTVQKDATTPNASIAKAATATPTTAAPKKKPWEK